MSYRQPCLSLKAWNIRNGEGTVTPPLYSSLPKCLISIKVMGDYVVMMLKDYDKMTGKKK
jgi:hypothetical protein